MVSVFVSVELAVAVHDRQLSEHSGATGIRDAELLESALMRPQQAMAYAEPPPDLAACAASLLYGLARNHPFVDGNKRTAMVCAELLIRLNGGELVATDAELFPVVLNVAEGLLDETGLADWFRAHIRVERSAVHEPSGSYSTE